MYDQSSGNKESHKFYGNFRGVVLDDQDPAEAGRVKIRIFSVYDDVPVSVIPWANFADPFMAGIEGHGGFITPDVGSHVWCFFENGDHMQPVYFAGAPARPHEPPERTTTNHIKQRGNTQYPRNKVLRTKAGHVIEIDDTPSNTRVRVAHKSGSEFTIFENGDMYHHVVGNLERVVLGDVTEYIGGKYERLTEGTVMDISNTEMDLRAPRIDLNE